LRVEVIIVDILEIERLDAAADAFVVLKATVGRAEKERTFLE